MQRANKNCFYLSSQTLLLYFTANIKLWALFKKQTKKSKEVNKLRTDGYSWDCSYQQRPQSPPLCHWWKLSWWSVFAHLTSRSDAPQHHNPPLSRCLHPARWRRLCSCSRGCQCQHLGSRSDERKEGTCETLEKRNKHWMRWDLLKHVILAGMQN